MKKIYCILGILLIGLQARAGEMEESLSRLEKTLQKPAAGQNAARSEAERKKNEDALLISQIRKAIGSQDYDQTHQLLKNFNGSQLSTDSKKALEDFAAALEKDEINNIENTLKRAAEAVRKAKKASELDAFFYEIQNLIHKFARISSEKLSPSKDKLRPAYDAIYFWQNCLAACEVGNFPECRKILNWLPGESFMNDNAVLPRSEVLSKLQQLNLMESKKDNEDDIEKLLAKTKNISQISNLTKELQRLDRNGKGGTERAKLSPYLEAAERMEHIYVEFQEGLPIDLGLLIKPKDPLELLSLKSQLLFLILPHYLDLPAGVKPRDKERTEDFLKRLENEAIQRGDLHLVWRVREVLNHWDGKSRWTSNDGAAKDKIQAAKNQEAAGQYMLAVISYQEALDTGSDAISPKLIGELLAILKKNHPADYDAGMNLFLQAKKNAIQSPAGNAGQFFR